VLLLEGYDEIFGYSFLGVYALIWGFSVGWEFWVWVA